MCDEQTEADNDKYLAEQSRLTRRDFNRLTAGAAVMAMLPQVANAATVVEQDVKVKTPDGTADCYFVHPAKGKHPGVILWPDVYGLRPAKRQMGKRLAESGYSVLVVNPYYRSATAPVLPAGASFSDPRTREVIGPMRGLLTAEANAVDARAFVAYLDAQKAVDSSRQMGTMGYCMGGPFTFRTAAAVPDRIGAGASFHGGGLVTSKPDSPHLLVPGMKAQFLIAVAENDDEKGPEVKTVLKETYARAGLFAEIEVYEGTLHGWCPPDSRVYNEAKAERAWSRLLDLFERALA